MCDRPLEGYLREVHVSNIEDPVQKSNFSRTNPNPFS